MKNVKFTLLAFVLVFFSIQSCGDPEMEEIENQIENPLYTEAGNDNGEDPSEHKP